MRAYRFFSYPFLYSYNHHEANLPMIENINYIIWRHINADVVKGANEI